MPGQRALCQLLHPYVQLVQLLMEKYIVILVLGERGPERGGELGPEKAKVLFMAIKG